MRAWIVGSLAAMTISAVGCASSNDTAGVDPCSPSANVWQPRQAAPSAPPQIGSEALCTNRGALGATGRHASDGAASYYAESFEGRTTASGEIFDGAKFTGAHQSLPFGTRVRVTNLNNNKSVIVRINDRGPFVPGRVIDLSPAAAKFIDMIALGTVPVRLDVLPARFARAHPF
jgi:peptidoglycan lytic transglycosylase